MADAKRRKVADSDAALLASLKSELGEFHTFWSGVGIDFFLSETPPQVGSSVNSGYLR